MKSFKKSVAILLTVLLSLSAAACNGNPVTPSSDVSEQASSSTGEATAITGETEAPTNSTVSESVGSQVETTTTKATTTKNNSSNSNNSNTPSKPQTDPEKGDKPLLDGLDFKGKYFTIAYTNDKTPDADEKAFLKKFEQKFNCRISTTVIAYDTYLDTLSKKVLSGGRYDVIMLESTHFPTALVNNLALPLNNYFTDKDLYDPKHIEKGGISLSLSDCFRGKDGKLYGLADPLSGVTGLYFYNKQALEDAGFGGAKDPYKLWTQGKWTWAAFEEMAKAFANPAQDKYLIDTVHGLVESTGASYISRKSDTEFSVNLKSDSRVFAAFNQIQKWINAGYLKKGEYQIFNYSGLVSGKYPMVMGTRSHYTSIKKQIAEAKSAAWNGGKTNLLGVVPPPQQKAGTYNLFPTGAPVCIGASKGSADPRFAVAYLLYKSNQSNYTSTDPYAVTSAEQKILNDIASVGKVNIFYQGFKDTTTTAAVQCHSMAEEIIKGADVTATLNKYQSVLEGLRDTQMKSWK